MRRVSNRSWTVAGIGVVLIVAAFSLSRAFGPLLAGGGVLLILAAYLAWGDLRSGPRLEIDRPFVELRSLERKTRQGAWAALSTPASAGGALATIATTHVGYGGDDLSGLAAYVLVSNQPRVGHRAAKHVHTRLSYYTSDGQLLHQIDGRWSSLPQHTDSERTLRGERITIPANETPEPVDIAWQYSGEIECSAFNDESRFRAPLDLRYRPLDASPVRVEVTAQGSGCRAAKTFTLSWSEGRLDITETV